MPLLLSFSCAFVRLFLQLSIHSPVTYSPKSTLVSATLGSLRTANDSRENRHTQSPNVIGFTHIIQRRIESMFSQPHQQSQSNTMATPRADLLDSWKEIACFFGREVRTVQLWEKHEGLPVHRHNHVRRASVRAYRSELTHWFHTRSSSTKVSPVV
jgi:hypothetical protein